MLEKHHVDRLRAIFISHTHHDHVMDAPYTAGKCSAPIYGSSSAMNVGRGGNVPEDFLIEFKPNETYEIGGFRIKVIPSIHSKPTILNNDLGQTIDVPLTQPARLRSYKEGGSFDFYVEAEGKKFMIRPSFNYIPGQMDGYEADVLFLGVAGLATSAANTAVNSKPQVQRSGSMGGAAGLMSSQKPYLIINRPRMSVPDKLNKFSGNTCNVTMKLSACTGFTMIDTIHLSGMKCTDNERDELMNILRQGVIF